MEIKILLAANSKYKNYVNAVTECGAIADAQYLPNGNTDYDGLILCGGNDIQPSYYNAEINGSRNFDIERDAAEFTLLKKFLKTGKPILGICRGHQLLNVALGGTLIQDLSNAKDHSSGADYDLTHEVCAKSGSVLEKLYGDRFYVNSAHHQAVKTLGEGLSATLFSDQGKTIEAFEHISKPYLGVQFHPERMCLEFKRSDTVNGLELFKYFISLCKSIKERGVYDV